MSPLPDVNHWSDWYATYIDRKVFLDNPEEGYHRKSLLFEKYFVNGCVDYLGKVVRSPKFSEVEHVNETFLSFCEANGYEKPRQFRRCFTNPDAGFKSASKYDRCQPQIDERAWALAGEWTIEHFQPYCGGSAILSLETVVQELERSTSAGYPWNRKYRTKGELLDSDFGLDMIKDFHEQIKTGNFKTVPIWTVSQKVELRSLEKLRENKVRTFTASPTEFSAVANTYCLDFNNKFYASANKTWSFVGCSPYLQGWNTLFEKLNVHPNAFELDESTYDCSLFRAAMYGQRDIRYALFHNDFKTEQIYMELTRVYDQIVNSVMVLENGELVRKDTGNPSGCVNTIVDNTMILYRLLAYAWIMQVYKKRVDEPKYPMNRPHFENNVVAGLTGDDNTLTVSDDVVSFYNATTISDEWSKIGVVTTTDCYEPRKLTDCKFLSHSFTYNKKLGIVWPVPDTQRMLCSLAFNSKDNDVRWHYLRACALRVCSYPNETCRTVIQNYINYLNTNFSKQLVGEINGISMKDIHNLWRSDKSIEALYAGRESLSSGARKIFSTALNSSSILAA